MIVYFIVNTFINVLSVIVKFLTAIIMLIYSFQKTCNLFTGRGGIANRIPPAHCGSPDHKVNNKSENYLPAARNRTPSGRFIDTINPLLTFSSEDMKIMDQEVEDLCKEDDEDDDDDDEDDDDNVDDDESESELDKKIIKTNQPPKICEDETSTTSSEDSLSGIFFIYNFV